MFKYRRANKLPLILALICSMSVLAQDKSCDQVVAQLDSSVEVQAKALAKISKDNYVYEGLSDEGIKALKNARDSIRQRSRLFENEILGLTSLHHAGMLSRMLKANMFIYGPPGGAKSMFVNWILNAEKDKNAFKLQMHQMITEQAFTGGQNFEAAKLGKFEINTQGSLADYTVALLDEIEKGNPAALASLLSLLNERQILAGNKVIKAKLETLFATSNANLPEIFQQFVENGQGSTAPALLNRFQIKGFVYNWLDRNDQGILDKRNARRDYLKILSKQHPEVLNDEVFQTPQTVEWEEMRDLAELMFEVSDETMAVFGDLASYYRTITNKAIKESEEKHASSPLDEVFVYFPSLDSNERMRQSFRKLLVTSAFIDLLQSPMLDDEFISSVTKKRIVLGPDSLWRAYTFMTTVGPGETRLVRNISKGEKGGDVEKFEISFGTERKLMAENARDKREELLIKNLQTEQTRFSEAYDKVLGDYQTSLQEAAPFAHRDLPGWKSNKSQTEISFEKKLIESRPQRDDQE